jgi:predicted site-specific integrase-resolvase
MIDLASEHVLTLSQAARKVGVCRSTVRIWVATGKLDGLTLPNGQVRTSLEALARACPGAQREPPETLSRQRRRSAKAALELREMGV